MRALYNTVRLGIAIGDCVDRGHEARWRSVQSGSSPRALVSCCGPDRPAAGHDDRRRRRGCDCRRREQHLQPRAVAIDGTTIVAVGPAADIAARFKAAEQIDTAGSIVIPGLINTHGHAPMVLYRGSRRRSAPAGMARKVHLSSRSQDRVARNGACRHATRRPGNDPVGHDGVRRHVLLRRGNRACDEGRRHARRTGPDDHPVSGGRCENTAGRPGAHRGVHQGVCEGRSHRARCRPALALYTRRQRPARLPCAGHQYGVPVLIHVAETETELGARRRRMPA